MRKMLLGLIATVMISVSGFASNVKNDSTIENDLKIEVTTKNQKVIVTKKLQENQSLEDLINTELDKLTYLEVDEDMCDVTVSAGYGATFVSVTVHGPCKGIMKRAKAYLAEAKAELGL